jgi:hypothetical protein
MDTDTQVRKLWRAAKQKFSALARCHYTTPNRNVDVLVVDQKTGIMQETTLSFPSIGEAQTFCKWAQSEAPTALGLYVECARCVGEDAK